MIRLLSIFLLVSLSVVPHASGGTYWVDDNGVESWANCQGVGPISGASACAYTTANTNAAAEDTVYFREGTYTISSGNGIDPANSGSGHGGSRIVFSAYNSESVEFVATHANGVGVNLNADNYIKVHGITFTNWYKPLRIMDGDYNEISNCSFIGCCGGDQTQGDWVGSRVRSGSMYNHIHDCTFAEYGYFAAADGNDNNVVFGIGIETSTTDDTHYNLIENCTFRHGGHHVVDFNGYQNIFRNSNIRNDEWSDYDGTDYGNRLLFTAGDPPDVQRNLFEGNRVGYGRECADAELGGSGGTWGSSSHIVRQNIFFQNYLYGMLVISYSEYNADNIHIYNNSFWYNGYSPNPGAIKYLTHAIDIEEDAYASGGVVKNNIFYANRNKCAGSPGSVVEPDCSTPDTFTVSDNFDSGDPLFIDITGVPDPALVATQFDFGLQSGSTAIDAGSSLTTVDSVTDGDTVVLVDAGYFFDGWTMVANIPTATIAADQICFTPTEAVTYNNCVEIAAINYSTNSIDTSTAHGASAGWYVWLHKNSAGDIVLYGTAPDQGAYKYSEETPANTIQGVTIGNLKITDYIAYHREDGLR